MKSIAIGPLIKKQFEARRKYDRTFTVSAFAKQINVHRATVYKIFEQHSVDVYLLQRISKVLNYDFLTIVNGQSPSVRDDFVIVGVKIPVSELQKLNLPKELLCLLELRAEP